MSIPDLDFLDIPGFPIDLKTAVLRLAGRKTALSISPQKHTEARIVTANLRLDAVEVTAHRHIKIAVTIKIVNHQTVHWRKLSIDRQGMEGKLSVAVIDCHARRKFECL